MNCIPKWEFLLNLQHKTKFFDSMNYIELHLHPQPMSEATCDILASLLAPLGYESFTNAKDGLLAYCPTDKYSATGVQKVLEDFPVPDVTCSFTAQEVATEDWNLEWEEQQNVEPIVIGKLCAVHSPLATDIPACRYDIVIEPRMSFGSGHHETTAQLLEEILRVPLKGKTCLDMGTGTGVLAILCAKCGAKRVRAIEIDDWVAANATDNVMVNGVNEIVTVDCGDASLLQEYGSYDLIVANINRNVLIADMETYGRVLKYDGVLLMSGFFEEDIPLIRAKAERLGFEFGYSKSRSHWAVVAVHKPIMSE